MHQIYFDYNATTPLDRTVLESMLPLLGSVFGNPSSVHRLGQHARAMLDEAREQVAAIWKCRPHEIVFTSGGTESNNLALMGVARRLRDKGRHIVASAIEHHAVLHCLEYLQNHEGFELTLLGVNSQGMVTLEGLEKTIRKDTILVSCMAANNQTGAVQPVAQLGAFCRERGVLFHTDAIQWFGKEPFTSIHQFNADLVSVCAHKYHGPKGVGALFVKSPLKLQPMIFGGGHEYERRAGTENLAGIVGLAKATELFVRTPVFRTKLICACAERLTEFLSSFNQIGIQSPSASRLVNTVAFSVTGCDSSTLLANLDMEGICASSGSACTSGSLQPSHVLLAMGADMKTAKSLIRLSLGRESNLAEIQFAESVLPNVLARSCACPITSRTNIK